MSQKIVQKSKPKWEDTSSHAQGTKDKTPREWTMYISGRALRIKIHRHIHYPPDAWLVTCHPKLLEQLQLEATDAEEAKKEAIRLVKAELERLLAGLPDG